jgi:hypothetical protein
MKFTRLGELGFWMFTPRLTPPPAKDETAGGGPTKGAPTEADLAASDGGEATPRRVIPPALDAE